MKCKCNDGTHDTLPMTLWHRAYCNWYDRDRGGNRALAAVWGWVADRLARFA